MLHAIEARQGIFQIVSLAANRRLAEGVRLLPKGAPGRLPEHAPSESILYKLLRHKPAFIGERYKIMGLQRSRSSDDRQSSFTLHLECVDDKSIIKIPLTQVGLQFDNSLLRTEEIEYAHDVLEYHVRRNNRLNESVASEPVIISQAGVIRNGTLMMYRSMMQKISDRTIKTDAELDQELASMIAEGRRARGPHFIDFTRQLSELRFALRKQLDVERQRAMNKQTTNKVSEIQYAERA